MAIDKTPPQSVMTVNVSAAGFTQAVEEGYFGNDVNILSTQGVSGYSGLLTLGVRGTMGYSGYSGYSGSSGYSGYSGISGYSGYSGISGYSGNQINQRSGMAIFNSVTGRLITHNLGTSSHHTSVTAIDSSSGFIGDVYVVRNFNDDVVYNTGIDNYTSFSWLVTEM